MADIDVERKGPGIWPWIIGLIVLALLIWLLAEWLGGDEAVVEEPVAGVVEPAPVPPVVTPEPIAQGPQCVAAVLGDPAGWLGRTIEECQMQVVEVPTDRGFWVEENGQRMFAIIIDQPAEEPKDINPGQTIRASQAVVRDRTFLPQIPGVPLDPDTERIAQDQPAFLVVDEANINILTQGTPQPGTDPAQTAPPGT